MKLSKAMERALIDLDEKGDYESSYGWISTYKAVASVSTLRALQDRQLVYFQHNLLVDYWKLTLKGKAEVKRIRRGK